MEKRLVIAIALSIFVMIAFQYFVGGTKYKKVDNAQPIQQSIVTTEKVIDQETLSKQEPAIEEKLLKVDTDRYIITFSNIGGSIKSIKLKDFKAHNSNEVMELLNISNPSDYLFSIKDITGKYSTGLIEYNVKKHNDVVICSAVSGDLEITKRYVLTQNKYGIDLSIALKNKSNIPMVSTYRLIAGAGISESADQDKRFVEPEVKIGEKVKVITKNKNTRVVFADQMHWVALKNKYFSIILKPLGTIDSYYFTDEKDAGPVIDLQVRPLTIMPNNISENKYVIYIGPSHVPALKEFGHDFEESVNYGFFGAISKLMLIGMRSIYKVVRNYGIAIIILAIFLNILLFPLTLKGFKSMQKMQELHPQMEKLKIKYKDNSQKLNQEIMELYKKYNINPFSGCLPMLLQMPVFVALYNALMKSIELRGAKFLWINDLSMPDAVKIPIVLPIVGNSINILPIIMIAAMVIQQKISAKSMGEAITEEQKQQQKMMLVIMPIVFGFIFYNMPSGLVLYWVVNTVLTAAEQIAMSKNT